MEKVRREKRKEDKMKRKIRNCSKKLAVFFPPDGSQSTDVGITRL